jgi:hypothetical protein
MIGQNYQNLLIQIYSKYNKWFYFFIIILVYLLRISLVSANTGINPQIPYSGSIIKNDGTVLSDGSYKSKFLIYNVSTGGVSIYEEIRDGNTTYPGTGTSPLLSVNDGRFEILLGSQNTTNFTSILNDDSLWLELQLDIDNNGSYEEVFSPRRRIGSAVSAINSLRLVSTNGGTDTDTLSLDVNGNVIATSLGGTVNSSTPLGFDRVLLANSSGQFSQVNISTLTSSLNSWILSGNTTTDAWNGTSGTRLGTTSAQPLVLATTNATAQDIRFFTGSNGSSERMRISGDGVITITPSNMVQVLNAGIMPSVGRSNNVRGIDWPDNPGGGSGDNAYIYYHIENGENTTLEIGLDDNPDDDIKLVQNGGVRLQIINGELVLGNGEQSTLVNGTLLRGPDASGTNITGPNLSIRAGNGTGTGGSGAILFSTSPTSSTGSSSNVVNERMRITPFGNVGIGTNTPTAKLNLAAGTATASTAPLKFTSGTNLTTPEAGALEWNGTNLFLTTSGNVRQTINQGLTATATLDFPSTNNDSFSNLTVTVTGALDGDVVSLGLPNASVPAANSNFTAWVSATNTVTVRFNNNSGASQDPASGSFKIFVTKF